MINSLTHIDEGRKTLAMPCGDEVLCQCAVDMLKGIGVGRHGFYTLAWGETSWYLTSSQR